MDVKHLVVCRFPCRQVKTIATAGNKPRPGTFALEQPLALPGWPGHNQAIPYFEVPHVHPPQLVVFVAFPATVLAFFLTLMPSAAEPAKPEGKRLALIVGVNEYQNRNLGDLKYAERDATELEAVLKKAGFTVRLLLGSGTGADKATKANVEKALEALLKGVGKRDVVLLAFSGHGQQMFVNETNPDGKEVRKEVPFFCPKDAVPSEAATLVSFNTVLRAGRARRGQQLAAGGCLPQRGGPQKGGTRRRGWDAYRWPA